VYSHLGDAFLLVRFRSLSGEGRDGGLRSEKSKLGAFACMYSRSRCMVNHQDKKKSYHPSLNRSFHTLSLGI
jgi:hypothetical protein